MDDIYVYLIDLPCGIKEMVSPCDGGYTVYLNARLTYHDRVKAYCHAMNHIVRHDWERSDVQQIEREAHEESRNIYESINSASSKRRTVTGGTKETLNGSHQGTSGHGPCG